jgi:hypothetical protein
VNPFPFGRLFSMPAFEGLRILRAYEADRPDMPPEELAALIGRVEASASSLDLDAALFLHGQVSKTAEYTGVAFYRECISTVILLDVPDWAKLVTLGRNKFIRRLRDDEYRDIRSVFREARLLGDPPDLDDVKWWDALQTYVRLQKDLEFNERSRDAELLSLEHEKRELARAGIDRAPVWMAIDDNTAGYDILSYRPAKYGPINKLIEVKSTIANPPVFVITRNEWEQALKFGEAFVFQIWVFSKMPPHFHERSVAEVAPHIPADSGRGKWRNAAVPLKR